MNLILSFRGNEAAIVRKLDLQVTTRPGMTPLTLLRAGAIEGCGKSEVLTHSELPLSAKCWL
jgi:hypothetical protein